MWAFILMTFFEGLSVSTAQRSDAILSNPAGLGFSPGIELTYMGDADNKHNLMLAMRNIGLFYSVQNNVKRYGIAEGIKLSRWMYGGFAYHLDESKELSLGLLIRPFDFLSFGYRFSRLKEESFNVFGLGLRPLGEYFTIFGDVMLTKDSIDNFVIGGSIEPIKGLKLYGFYNKDKEYHLGIDFAVDFIRWGASGNKDAQNYSFSVSREPRRSFIPHKKVITVRLEGGFSEIRVYGFLGKVKKPSFMDLVTRLDSLSREKDIKEFVFILKPAYFSLAQLEELKNVIGKIRENGKKVIFYADVYGIGGYFLAASADYIYLNPSGDVMLPGLSSTSLFFRRALDKIGVKPEFDRIGRYKSAVEPFISDTMSKYNREQIKVLLEDIYNVMKGSIEGLDSLLETAYFNAEEALRYNLVDGLIYESDLDSIIKQEFPGKVKKERLFTRTPSYVREKWGAPRSYIAYLVADGSIVTGKSGESPIPIPFLGGRRVGSETIEKIFEKLRKNKKVKAVVLRVNSPGGSALASEIMWRAIRRCAEKKPVIVSMGGVAASGGYYISSAATKILADKTTVTGSIGILNGKFVIKNLLNKLGITFETIKIGPHADALSSFREMTQDEREMMRKELEWGYNKFLDRVSRGRGLSPDSINVLGEGRIWSGLKASEVGLVDSLGGVLDAISLAKELSGAKDAALLYIKPFKKPIFGGMPISTSLFKEEYLYLDLIGEIKLR